MASITVRKQYAERMWHRFYRHEQKCVENPRHKSGCGGLTVK